MPNPDLTFRDHVQSATKLDGRPLANLPSPLKVALAGICASVGSILADRALVALGKALFTISPAFGPFHFQSYAPLTVLGVAAATVGWGVLVRLTSRPRWLLARAAAFATVLLLVPDVLIFANNPPLGVVTLMAMHIAIAVITFWSLLLIAPATGQARKRLQHVDRRPRAETSEVDAAHQMSDLRDAA